ncbi:hypothetical protein E3O06_06815 [Cryobacterium glaciale]|uniref:Uncharacterized protein n=1 Tax=Cryobacterium glaciale TaxID=1259145 RepID=A0A4R8V1R0_9MICO|nr:hypothetical protein [Cryobacterium glaciale]TFB74806.1 hypothetical protein E3O06_06815 [Cryobacterium glaciale]
MTSADEFSIVNIAEAPWDDVRTVVGTRGDPSRCWCQFFKTSNAGWDATTSDIFCADLRKQIAQARSPCSWRRVRCGVASVGGRAVVRLALR